MDLMRAQLGGEVCTPGGDPRPEKAKTPWHIDNPRPENGRFGDQRPLSLPEAARYLNVTDRYVRRVSPNKGSPTSKSAGCPASLLSTSTPTSQPAVSNLRRLTRF
jgi:hypothetical protein